MRFDLKKPCPECPFTRAAGGYLTPERAREISQAVLYGNLTFACHKHLNGTHDELHDAENGMAAYQPSGEDQHCAGALAMYDKLASTGTGHHYVANQMIQIAERFGLRDPERLDARSGDDVYDSVKEMAQAHHSNQPRTRTKD